MTVRSCCRVSLLACVVAVVALVAGSCGREQPSEIIIGSSLPLTGPDASYGQNARRGIELALSEVVASGGIEGRSLKIIFEDDEGVPKNGATIMNRFVADPDIRVVIGAVHSTVTLAMASVANKHRRLLISPISSSAQLTSEGGDYFFRLAPSDAFQARVLAEWVSELGFRRAGVVFVNNIWGESLASEFGTEFTQRGGEVAAREASQVGQLDFRTQLAKLAAARSDVFVFLTQAKEGGKLIKQATELGYRQPVFGGDTWSSVEFVETAGEAADGVRIVMPAQYTGSEFRSFSEAFESTYGVEPDVNSALAYDTLKVLAHAISEVGYDADRIREYLLSMPVYVGASGRTEFDQNGDCVSKEFERIVFRGQQKVTAAEGSPH